MANIFKNVNLQNEINELKNIGEKIKENSNKVFDVNELQNFATNTVRTIGILSVYFYFGASFLILSKNAQTYKNGIPGQNPDKPPYKGNFRECHMDIDVAQSFFDWTFPYKNSILCNKEYNINRPLSFRVVSFLVHILSHTYAFGRKFLNGLLFTINDSVILLGPLIFIIMLLIQPIFSQIVSIGFALTGYEKLLPHCYATFWFPITTFMIFLWTIFFFSMIVTFTQTVHLIGYILYPTFGKINIIDGHGEHSKIKESRGFFDVLKIMFNNGIYLLITCAIIIYNSYSYLNIKLAIPIIIVISYILFKKLNLSEMFGYNDV